MFQMRTGSLLSLVPCVIKFLLASIVSGLLVLDKRKIFITPQIGVLGCFYSLEIQENHSQTISVFLFRLVLVTKWRDQGRKVPLSLFSTNEVLIMAIYLAAHVERPGSLVISSK